MVTITQISLLYNCRFH